MNRIGLFGGALLAAGVAATAFADTYTDRGAFEGDFPGLFNLDFEGYAPDGSFLQPAPDFSPLGASFSDSSDDGVDDTAIADSGFFFGTPTDAFFINEFDAQAIIDLDPQVGAIGMDIATGFGGLGATVEVFDSGGGLLASESFDTEAEQIFTTFIGFGNLGDIARIVVTPEAGGFVLLDNVTYGEAGSCGGPADLNGDNVSLELWSSDSGSLGVNNVTVGAGEDTNFFSNQFVDFNGGGNCDTFTIRSTGNFSSIDGAGGRIEWRLTDLDFPGGSLVDVNIITPFSDVSVVDLTGNSVTFEYEDVEIPAAVYFEAQFVVAGSGPTDVLYTTDGDGATMTMYQGNSATQSTTHVRGYPLTVRGSVWIGDYNGAQPNAIEYDLNGNPTGNTVTYDNVLAVDATTDGNAAYELGNAFNSSATVYKLDANLDSSNRSPVFDVSGDNRFVGITYDSGNNTLWISSATFITQYDFNGNIISQFDHAEGDGHALAFEHSTQTLWTARGATLWQYDRNGNLLQTVNSGTNAGNNWGAEFAFPGDDCPADLDGDGDTDADDFFAYLDGFANGDLDVCDIDGDGDCDADDFFGYLDLFAQGC